MIFYLIGCSILLKVNVVQRWFMEMLYVVDCGFGDGKHGDRCK